MRIFWQVRRGRHIEAFSEKYRLKESTVFPQYRKMRLPKKGYISDIVKYCNYVQMHSVVRYISELGNEPIIVDVGAHHGSYAIVLGNIAKKMGGKLIAVEPNPHSFKLLEENVQLNELGKTVICEKIALADAPGHMYINECGSQSHIATSNKNGYPVEVITLEQLLDKHGIDKIDLLIIDVEGAELPVLEGFPWETKRVGRIYCEMHPYAWKEYGYGGEDVKLFLNKRKYLCFDMYLKEHKEFASQQYIGPTLFIPAYD